MDSRAFHGSYSGRGEGEDGPLSQPMLERDRGTDGVEEIATVSSIREGQSQGGLQGGHHYHHMSVNSHQNMLFSGRGRVNHGHPHVRIISGVGGVEVEGIIGGGGTGSGSTLAVTTPMSQTTDGVVTGRMLEQFRRDMLEGFRKEMEAQLRKELDLQRQQLKMVEEKADIALRTLPVLEFRMNGIRADLTKEEKDRREMEVTLKNELDSQKQAKKEELEAARVSRSEGLTTLRRELEAEKQERKVGEESLMKMLEEERGKRRLLEEKLSKQLEEERVRHADIKKDFIKWVDRIVADLSELEDKIAALQEQMDSIKGVEDGGNGNDQIQNQSILPQGGQVRSRRSSSTTPEEMSPDNENGADGGLPSGGGKSSAQGPGPVVAGPSSRVSFTVIDRTHAAVTQNQGDGDNGHVVAHLGGKLVEEDIIEIVFISGPSADSPTRPKPRRSLKRKIESHGNDPSHSNRCLCGKQFENMSQCCYHAKTFNIAKAFSCKCCAKRFAFAGQLKEHLLKRHKMDLSVEDILQNYGQARDSSADKGEGSQVGLPSTRSTSGSGRRAANAMLRMNMPHDRHPSKPFHCVCGLKFKKNVTLYDHIRWFTGKNLSCKYCSKEYVYASQLKLHYKEAHKAGFKMSKSSWKNVAVNRRTVGKRLKREIIEEPDTQENGTNDSDEFLQSATVEGPDDKKRYCLCNQVSHGDMVECDNRQNCPMEWFHYGCVGLTSAPQGKWYCPECSRSRPATVATVEG